MKHKRLFDPQVRATLLASRWARKFDYPMGNLWEPALVRYMLKEHTRLGGDAGAWAFVEAMTARQLGIDVEV